MIIIILEKEKPEKWSVIFYFRVHKCKETTRSPFSSQRLCIKRTPIAGIFGKGIRLVTTRTGKKPKKHRINYDISQVLTSTLSGTPMGCDFSILGPGDKSPGYFRLPLRGKIQPLDVGFPLENVDSGARACGYCRIAANLLGRFFRGNISLISQNRNTAAAGCPPGIFPGSSVYTLPLCSSVCTVTKSSRS